MPISRDQLLRIDDGSSGLDLSLDTSRGRMYRFLQTHASHAIRRVETVDAIDGPEEAIESSLNRLEQRGFVEHRGWLWTIADCDSPSFLLVSMVS